MTTLTITSATRLRLLDDLAPDDVHCVYERELYVARGVASGDIELTPDLLVDVIANLVVTLEEKAVASE